MSRTTATRRSFLGRCLATGAASTIAAAHAMEPIERTGAAKFKFSLAAYSYRDLLTSGQLTLSDFIADCAAMQLDATELTSYYFPASPTEAYLRQLKSECFRLGLAVSGTAVGNDFGLPTGPERQQQIENVKQWVDRAEILGAPVIRIFAGSVPSGDNPAEVNRRIVAGIEECCQYAGQHGVYLALENHGGPTATADGLLSLVRAVKSPWFGVNLDSGNFRTTTIYDDLARVAPYALNVQVKVVTVDPNGTKRPMDFRRLANILRASGYRGYVALEYEEAGDPRVACRKYVEKLREAFA